MGRKTKIDWAESSWNPLTGCYHGCPYCYARGIARRFASKDPDLAGAWRQGTPTLELDEPYVYNGKREPYPFGFTPTFHRYRLDEPQSWKEPRTVFVCSMSDLFGEWVPDRIIDQVVKACRKAPQHRYLFLTKNPRRYDSLFVRGIFTGADTNFWLGSTVTDLDQPAHFSACMHTFWSVEPILAPWPERRTNPNNACAFPEWVILGAETGNRKNKVIPTKEWVDHIVDVCTDMGAVVFMKDSLVPVMGEENMIREFPWNMVAEFPLHPGL